MKTIRSLLVLTCGVVLAGCGGMIYGPVEQVKAFIDEKDEVILQIGKTIEANPTVAGLEAARKVFEGRKESLKTRKEAINKAGRGVNGDWITRLADSKLHDTEMFDAIRTELSSACSTPPRACTAEQEKLSALEKDFKATTD